MKSLGSTLGTLLVGLLVVAAVAPVLISLSHALLPILVIAIAGAAALRLLWFHTRRW